MHPCARSSDAACAIENQFEVESYLRYRGSQFVDRFDANSYIYITKAMDYFDLTGGAHRLGAAFEKVKARFLVISFTSDWLYPSYQSLEVVRALRGRNCDVAYCELPSSYGHDAFLVNVNEQTELVRGFLASTFRERSGARRYPSLRSASEGPLAWPKPSCASCWAAATTPSSAN